MRSLLLLTFGLLPCLALLAQENRYNATVFESAEDYRSNKGIDHNDHEGFLKWGFKFFYLFRDGEQDLVSYKEGRIWGFRWRDDVYRCAGADGAVKLLEQGEVFLWRGKGLYISHGVDGDLLPLGKLRKHQGKKSSEAETSGQVKDLYDCLQACPEDHLARRCVRDHNGVLLGELK
jgi:hypothetical protein